MQAYFGHIEEETLSNNNFRKVLYTGPNSQLVVMALVAGEEIGVEVHQENDQFFRIEQGQARLIVDGQEFILNEDDVAIVPSGAQHNVINNSATEALKLYTIYSPAHHPDGTIHVTKADALTAEN